VPVTAKLSRRFYETFGDEIANELVEWFNRVDDAYRSEFRELFEVHFSRFDAKLEQRTAELDARWGGRFAQLEAKLEQRLAELDTRWGGRFAQLEAKLEQRLVELRGELRGEIGLRVGQLEARLEQRLAEVQSGLMKWMFIFWAGNVVATASLVLGAVVLLRK